MNFVIPLHTQEQVESGTVVASGVILLFFCSRSICWALLALARTSWFRGHCHLSPEPLSWAFQAHACGLELMQKRRWISLFHILSSWGCCSQICCNSVCRTGALGFWSIALFPLVPRLSHQGQGWLHHQAWSLSQVRHAWIFFSWPKSSPGRCLSISADGHPGAHPTMLSMSPARLSLKRLTCT